MADQGTNIDSTVKSPICKKNLLGNPEHPRYGEGGDHIGNGGTLGGNLISNITLHPFYTDPGSIEAHHLICSESMRSGSYWKAMCWIYGYNINHKKNGVFLPNIMPLACQLRVPLHRGGHSAGGRANKTYPKLVKTSLESVKNRYANSQCNEINKNQFIEDLNTVSKNIFYKVKMFAWIITYDGYNYHWANPVGCGNFNFMDDVRETLKKLARESSSFARGHIGALESNREFRKEKMKDLSHCSKHRNFHFRNKPHGVYPLQISR